MADFGEPSRTALDPYQCLQQRGKEDARAEQRGMAMLPFTVDQFFSVFGAYNNAVWPTQVVAYLLGAVAV
jgi:hypothetical protein